MVFGGGGGGSTDCREVPKLGLRTPEGVTGLDAKFENMSIWSIAPGCWVQLGGDVIVVYRLSN